VRLETGDGGKHRAAKSPSATENGTSNVNQTGRAKQSAALGDSIQSLANQLLGSNYFGKDSDESERDSGENDSASMVEEDIRTPPKLKSQIKHKQSNQHVKATSKPVTSTTQRYTESDEIDNKGVAVPVIIEDDEDVEKTMEKLSYAEPLSVPQVTPSTTPKRRLTTKITTPTTTRTTTYKPFSETTSSDGVSTWILLSGSSSSTTPTIKRKNNKTPTPAYVKSTHTTPAGDLYKNSPIHSSTIFTTSTTRPIRPITHNPSQNVRKNVTQTIDFFEPARTRKPHPTRTTTIRTSTTTTTTSPAPVSSTTKRRPTPQLLTTQKVMNRVTTIKPPVVTIIRVPEATPEPIPEESEENYIEEGSTEDSAETTTKRTRQPTSGNKKRKKNKNRRRRPTKKPGTSEDPESKIDEDNTESSNNKIAVKERPLSTRIYNYLAREVMPSVGVGLIGLVVTAGLAGLFMYPFGGGLVTRRTYEEAGPHHHLPSPNGYYHPGEYQGEIEGGQSEEEVFGKLLEGMNDKGEFTYSSIGEETAGYIGASGDALKEHDNRYKTGITRLEESLSSYNPSGDSIQEKHQKIRYSGGRIDDTNRYNGRIRYETVQGPQSYSQETYTGENKGNPTYPQFGTSGGFPTDSSKEKHPYSPMAIRSGEVEDSRETQPIYSATNGGTKQYSVGSVHMDTNPHLQTAGTVSSENTGFESSYYKPHYAESQPYIDDMYKGLSVVGSQNYGNVQVDSKPGAVHTSGSVVGEVSTGTKYKTASIPESSPIASQQYRRLIPDTKQQYRDVIGTQPRSGGTIVAVSVSKEGSSQIAGEKNEANINNTKFKPIHVNKDTDESKEELNASDRTLEVQNDQENQQQWDTLRYRGFSDVLSDLTKTSAEFQKRGSLQAGLMEQGPRNLRRKRNVDNFSNSKDNDIDSKLNEIDSDDKNMQLNWRKDMVSETNAEKNQSIPVRNNDKEIITGNLGQQLQDSISETHTPSLDEEVTTLAAENNDLSTDLGNDITTVETEIPTTTDYSLDDDVEEDDDNDDDEDDDGTEKPHIAEIVLNKNDTVTKRPNYSEPTKVPDTQFSLIGLFRRIARFKIQMGLNLLKSTTQAFTNYIDRVQKRIDKSNI
ncbi:hypothetical protein C0J52_28464, partial [Blattella germanica]